MLGKVWLIPRNNGIYAFKIFDNGICVHLGVSEEADEVMDIMKFFSVEKIMAIHVLW
jgi:hypothetical protein